MEHTKNLLTETLEELYKKKLQYENTLSDINDKIASHESVIKIIKDGRINEIDTK